MSSPKHVAIIPDGNRRWAQTKGLGASKGHEHAGQRDRLRDLLSAAIDLGLDVFSLWVFSTENWKRPKIETAALFKILGDRLKDLEEDALSNDVRVIWVGRRDRVPQSIKKDMEKIELSTVDCRKMKFVLCLDYGGRDEILRAVNKAVENGIEVSTEKFSDLLDTKGLPDIDLIIRTSGEQRLSGFMPWQATYAELHFVQKHFPDFTPVDLRTAVEEFSSRNRRFGGN